MPGTLRPMSSELPIALQPLQSRPGPLLVGFSGGLDSSVLLHRLRHDPALRTRRISAIHIHHGLHPDAGRWQRHCETVCAQWQVPLQCIRVDVQRNSGDGLEAAAREARHAAFAGALPANGVVALAQHQDDQAETVLLRALRGSGVDGLAAMRPWRPFANGWLWRPLLHLPRARLLAYARAHGLGWIEDPSNAGTQFDRNYLRHEVMPRLAARWPHAAARLAHVATLQAGAQALLDADSDALLAHCLGDTPDVLNLTCLHPSPPARRARLLRAWISQLGLPPLPGHAMARIETDLIGAAPGTHARFQWRGAELTRWRDLLHAGRVHAPLPADFRHPWHPHAPLSLPDGGQLRLISPCPIPADLVWSVHTRRGGERIVLPGRGHSHSLKHALQQRAIPPWLRVRLPLVSTPEGILLAAGDQLYSAAFKRWLDAHRAQLIWTATDRPHPLKDDRHQRRSIDSHHMGSPFSSYRKS